LCVPPPSNRCPRCKSITPSKLSEGSFGSLDKTFHMAERFIDCYAPARVGPTNCSKIISKISSQLTSPVGSQMFSPTPLVCKWCSG